MSFSMVYCSFAYYLSSQLLEWYRFIRFVIICMFVTVLSEGLGLCLGTTLETVVSIFQKLLLRVPHQHFEIRSDSLMACQCSIYFWLLASETNGRIFWSLNDCSMDVAINMKSADVHRIWDRNFQWSLILIPFSDHP